MKFMVSCRHTLVDLEKADEIRVDYKDKARLADFVTDKWQHKKPIYIYIPRDQIVDWAELNVYHDILDIVIAVEDTALLSIARDNGYKTFWSYPVATYWEMRGLLDLGVSEIILDAPLYFDLPKVKQACGNIEIRLVVNKCINGYMKRKNGICGTYVRPEDVDLYGEYVDHMEFDTDGDLRKEMALLQIYKYDKYFPGNLNILLTYLGENVDNRGFDEDFGQKRLDCYQSCQRDGRCHYCQSTFTLITTMLKNKKEIAQQIEEIDKAQEISG